MTEHKITRNRAIPAGGGWDYIHTGCTCQAYASFSGPTLAALQKHCDRWEKAHMKGTKQPKNPIRNYARVQPYAQGVAELDGSNTLPGCAEDVHDYDQYGRCLICRKPYGPMFEDEPKIPPAEEYPDACIAYIATKFLFNEAEMSVVLDVVSRIEFGHEKYGPLDFDTDTRNFALEEWEDGTDAIVWTSIRRQYAAHLRAKGVSSLPAKS